MPSSSYYAPLAVLGPYTRFHLPQHLSDRSFWRCHPGSCVCRTIRGEHSCWWSARSPSRRYDLILSTRRRRLVLSLTSELHACSSPWFSDVVRALSEAINLISRGEHDPHKAHERVRGMYDWSKIAARTEVVYDGVIASEPIDLFTRMERFVLSAMLLVLLFLMCPGRVIGPWRLGDLLALYSSSSSWLTASSSGISSGFTLAISWIMFMMMIKIRFGSPR